jgi:hypothetical protein
MRPFGARPHFTVVHPEFVLGGRHHDFGVGKGRRVVGGEQPVDMVLVVVRNDHRIDVLAIDTGSCKVFLELPTRRTGLCSLRRSKTGIDCNQLRTGIHDDGIENQRNLVFGHVCLFQSRVDPVSVGIVDEVVRQRERPCAVGDDGDFQRTDFIAIEAGRLLA